MFPVNTSISCCLTLKLDHPLSFTIYPIAPIMTKPIPTALLMLRNSFLSAMTISAPSPWIWRKQSSSNGLWRDIRFVHLFMNCVPSFKKSLGISANSLIWSDILI